MRKGHRIGYGVKETGWVKRYGHEKNGDASWKTVG